MRTDRFGSGGACREGRLSFIRNVSITFSTKIALFAIGVVTSIVMARVLGPEGKGLFSLAVLAAAVTYNSTNLGVGMGSGYLLGRRKISFEQLAGNWLSLSVLIGCGVFVAAAALAPYLVPRILPSVPVWFVIVTLGSVPFSILRFNFQSLFKASNDFRRFNIIDLAQPAFYLAAFAALVAFFPGRRLELAVIIFFVSNTAAGLLGVGLMARATPLRPRWSSELVGAAVRFGIQGHLATFLAFLNLRLDLLLVNIFLAPRFVGYYSISVMIAEKLFYVPDVLAVVLHPRIAHGGEEDSNRETAIVCRQTILIVLAGIAGVLLFGHIVVHFFYGDRFMPAVAALFLLLPGIFFLGLGRLLSSDLLARGYPRVILWAGLASLIANVALNVVLIPRYGINGAALATTVSYTLNALVVFAAFFNITGVGPRSLLLPGARDVRLLLDGARTLLTRRNKERP
jgi:O-antigen/teichoic acid export membrane protein